MKKIILILTLSVPLFTYAQRLSSSVAYVRASYQDGESIYCEPQQLLSRITYRRVIVRGEKFALDLKIVKKNIGEMGSWLGRNDSGTYYLITAIPTEYGSLSVFLPVDKNYNRIDYLPVLTISTLHPICDL